MKAHGTVFAAFAVALLASAGVAAAGDNATSMSYISYLERYATLRPAHEAESLEAQINMPVLSGDRLETSRGARVEVVLADGLLLWIDEFTTVDFDALAFSREAPAERTAVYLASGSVVFEIPDTALADATTRVETPAGVVFLHRQGLYRLDVRGNQLVVAARAGLAELPAGLGSALLRGGQVAWLDGAGGLQKAALGNGGDEFWVWVEARRSPPPSGRTATVVDARHAGRAAVLDSYGDWVYVSSFSSWMWRPRVSVGWSPYTYGRWYWTPAGWTWISYEPWGWYPSHYGSWYLDAQFGWVWCWDWVWGPAWVHWIYTPGYVGWAPRGYYDWWYWNRHPDHHYGHRWTRSALDFSGRVRLRDVDPRPWTIVAASDFGSSHLDRVRIDARRVLRDVPDGREGFVRSGPLLTSDRAVSSPSDLFDRDFRTTERTQPGLGTLLGRGGDREGAVVTLPVRSIDTAAAVRVPERGGAGSLPGRGLSGGRDEAGSGRTSPGTVSRGAADGDRGTATRRSTGGRSTSGEGGRSSSPPTTSRPSSPPPTTSRPSSPPPTTSRPSSPPPTTSRPSSPPPSARPSASGGRSRDGSSADGAATNGSRTPVAVVRGGTPERTRVALPQARQRAADGGSWSSGPTTNVRRSTSSSRPTISVPQRRATVPRAGTSPGASGTAGSGSSTRASGAPPRGLAPRAAAGSATGSAAPRTASPRTDSSATGSATSRSNAGHSGRTSNGSASRRR